LLANAVYQSPEVLADTPHSRASPLPHFVCIPNLNRTTQIRAVFHSAIAERFVILRRHTFP
ncbi:hypothetical protein, partial [Pseudomonas sp.]|uniref:hypothetical protein n=1 Tax=Pseudomonas sp. TaxID=306 RepID=UPI003C529866